MSSQRIETPDGLSWHVETFPPSDLSTSPASGHDYVVLIPSGEGDCHNLTTVAKLLSTNTPYHVLTFDMPGMSRTTAPASAYARVTPRLLATQIIGLLDKLHINRASFFGCSSGGLAVLALCAFYPSRAKCGVVHEVPLDQSEQLAAMAQMSDEQIVQACESTFGGALIEQDANDGAEKWKALGPEYHARLKRNYVTWIRGYVDAIEVGGAELASEPENLKRRPIFWTVGALNPGVERDAGRWATNIKAAKAAGLEVERERLRCLHFPSVTVPDELAAWIAECIGKVET